MLLAHEASLKRQKKKTPHTSKRCDLTACLRKHTYVTHLEMNLNIFSQTSYPLFFLTTLIKKIKKMKKVSRLRQQWRSTQVRVSTVCYFNQSVMLMQ